MTTTPAYITKLINHARPYTTIGDHITQSHVHTPHQYLRISPTMWWTCWETLMNMLSKSVDKHGWDWDTHLPYLVFAYRVAVQGSTRASPFYLSPTDSRSPITASFSLPSGLWWLRSRTCCTVIWCLGAWENVRTAQARQKRHFHCKSSDSKLKVGDRVMVSLHGAAQRKAWKLARPYFGPYQIVALTPTNAEIRSVNQSDGSETLFMSLDRVRPCYRWSVNRAPVFCTEMNEEEEDCRTCRHTRGGLYRTFQEFSEVTVSHKLVRLEPGQTIFRARWCIHVGFFGVKLESSPTANSSYWCNCVSWAWSM